jgi:von Willebrand factor type A domain
VDPNTVYGAESNLDVPVPDLLGNTQIQNLTHLVEPWSTGIQITENRPIRPWEPTHENQGVPHDYHHISVVAPPCYDTNLSTFRIDEVENPLDADTNRFQVIFNDVPEEETTWRAAVIRVYTCQNTTFRVKPGTEPGAPFGVEVGQATAVFGALPHLFQDVRIWFSYTAGAVGTAPHDDGPLDTTIICDETGEEFPFELKAHSIHRPTVAVQMVLDQSGSMADPAGTSGLTRLEVLKDAANLFATVIQNNNGLGIVRFDQDAYPPNDPTFGGMAITKITSDADRDAAHNAIDAHDSHGSTSVGDGLIMGHNQLIALPAGDYEEAALLLLTDGIENEPASIADAIGMGAVDNTVFAVGLGNEFQVNTAALNSVSGTTGGNLLLSGVLTSGTDDFFRVKKFFLQILAAVTNTSIVRDPTGYINVGTKITIPFQLSEADINCRVILLTDFPVVNLSVETPDGQVIDEANAGGFGVTFQTNGNTKTSSFNLPIAFQAQNIQAGTWNAILEIDEALYRQTLSRLRDEDPAAAASLKGKGARYSLSTHSFSNLRMTAAVTQDAYEPGSTLNLRATLNEYNLPVENRARVRADLEYPDHTHGVLSLAEIQPGVFETAMVANMPGIYRFNVLAKGVTYHGVPFTREQILNAAIFRDRWKRDDLLRR